MSDTPAAYTLSDLQKAISDERAAAGRREKDLKTEVEDTFRHTFEHQMTTLQEQSNSLEHDKTQLQSVLSRYEETLWNDTVEIIQRLAPAPDSAERLIAQMKTKSVLEAYESMKLIDHHASQQVLAKPHPMPMPRRSEPAKASVSAIDKLRQLV